MAIDAADAPSGAESNEQDDGSSDIAQDDDFAADMWEGTTSEGEDTQTSTDTQQRPAGTAKANQQNAAQSAEFDPARVNLTRVDINEVPEQFRPLVQKAQEDFKGMQTTLNERDQRIEALELNQQPQAIQPSQNQQPRQQQGIYDQYSYLGDTSHLDPQEREEFYQGASQVDLIFTEKMKPFQAYLDAMPSLVEVLGQLYEGHINNNAQSIEGEWAGIQGTYPDNELTPDIKASVGALMSTVNGATGNRFTRMEAFERVAGISAQRAAEMRQRYLAARNGAKGLVGGGTPPPTAGAPGAAHLSGNEANDRMALAGWPE